MLDFSKVLLDFLNIVCYNVSGMRKVSKNILWGIYMKKKLILSALIGAIILSLSSCDQGERINDLENQVDDLEKQIEELTR